MSGAAPDWKVTLSDVDLGPDEEAAVVDVLRSGWLSVGEVTAAFEREFATFVGSEHAVAVANGTAALHLAMAAVGIGPGDEVIVPSLTFVATANAAVYCGATPVFADIVAPERPLLDPDDVARKITERTRAIAPVHYAGYACDMDAFGALAAEHGLAIVEDGAHAPGSTFRGRPIGSIGNVTCFSFFSNKNLTTGEGGMVTTDDEALASRMRTLRSHGMSAPSYDRRKGHAYAYDVPERGWNYRMTEIEAALGRVQLAKLPRNNERRRERVADYRARLCEVEGMVVPFEGRDAESSCHILPVVLPDGADRAAVQARLRDEGIQTSMHYPPIHRFGAYRDTPAEVPRTDALAPRLLTLPLHPKMSEADVDLVCSALRRALAPAAATE